MNYLRDSTGLAMEWMRGNAILSQNRCIFCLVGSALWHQEARKMEETVEGWRYGGCPGICEYENTDSGTSSNYVQCPQKDAWWLGKGTGCSWNKSRATEEEALDGGKEKQGRPKKGKQPVQAAMECPGSSSESKCEVRRRSQRVRQFPARFQADSSSESESDSGILCEVCSAREPPYLNVAVILGCTVETVVTSFILPVYLVTIAVFSYELCSVSF